MENQKDYHSSRTKAMESAIDSHVDNWISSKKEKISLDNSALFKGKDIRFLDEVNSFLKEHKIEAKLEGSAVYNARKGNPRVYGDIDLSVAPSEAYNNMIARESIAKLIRASKGIERLYDWKVSLTSRPKLEMTYVNSVVDYRFRIESPRTKTSIDLSFLQMGA
jgi:hypothetical protein